MFDIFHLEIGGTIPCAPPSWASIPLSQEGAPNKKNGFGRWVLRPALLSVANDHASRRHQAIILSSEQHATSRDYTPPAATAAIFFFWYSRYVPVLLTRGN
jgi:phytoene dehydrogenase-like protein